MRVRKAILLILTFLCHIPVLAQVDTAWVRRYNGPANGIDQPCCIKVDQKGNVYVTGRSTDTPFYAYDSYDYCTVKYDPNGATLWIRRYNGPGDSYDVPYSLAIDDSENVYVTGESWNGSSSDYATIKYGPNGDTIWVRRYNGPGNNYDGGKTLVVDSSQHLYVTGLSEGSGTSTDYATIKYAPNGDTSWVRRYNEPSNNTDRASDLAIDDSGNVVVTGYSVSDQNFDFLTVKYTASGDTVWTRRYNGPDNMSDFANKVVLDNTGNILITGLSNSITGADYATVKYNASGDLLWVKRYNGPVDGNDMPTSLTMDSSGNVYVTGYSVSMTGHDFATIKYAANGDTVWIRRYKIAGDFSYCVAVDLKVDNYGNVYVTGDCYRNYTTVKYAPYGDILWTATYDSPRGIFHSFDVPHALTVDPWGNVYVTGESGSGSGEALDYLTIKYIQFDCIALSGDVNEDSLILLSDITTLINSLFKSQPAPDPLCRGDVNVDGKVLLSDVVYLINFLYKSGPAPQKSRECCL